MADKSPKQSWRKIQFRLRLEQLDEANVLKDYDARSQLLGRSDHDYIRRLLLIGHLFVSKMEASGPTNLALSTNESNNTKKELAHSSNNESRPVEVVTSEPNEVVGSAIRGMVGIFGDVKKSS